MVKIKDPAAELKPLSAGSLHTPARTRRKLEGQRFVLTTAQNNTRVHKRFWKTLQHFCEVNKAQLGVSKITYNKNGWQKVTTDSDGLWYDDALVPYFINKEVEVAPGLIFCANLDILPTAKLPLTGLDNYTGPHSAIVPHTKQQMKSVATMKYDEPKFLYTTGAVTLRNYIQRLTGQIAQYHHVFGALFVEVDDAGNWFVRQLNADENGIVYDLDRVYGPGWDKAASEFGRPLVTLGDIHLEKLDTVKWRGAENLLADLRPEEVFIHDLIDFEKRNHHNKKDPIFLIGQLGKPSIEESMRYAYSFLEGLHNKFVDTKFVVVKSNHDEALERWVREGSGFLDPENLRYWHELNYFWMLAIERQREVDVLGSAIIARRKPLERVQFLRADQSYVLRDIEHGMHGHLGPRGSRPTGPKSFKAMGRKTNTMHTHSAEIIDGSWTGGTVAKDDLGYNRGPGSSSASHIITHPNGKRQMITQRGDKYRA